MIPVTVQSDPGHSGVSPLMSSVSHGPALGTGMWSVSVFPIKIFYLGEREWNKGMIKAQRTTRGNY